MKTLLSIGVAALGALVAGLATPAPRANAKTADAQELAELQQEVARLQDDLARLEHALRDRAQPSVAAPSSAAPVSEADIAAAVERWRETHPASAASPDGPEGKAGPAQKRARPVELPVDVTALSIPDVVRLLGQDALTEPQREQLFQELRDAGRIDDYVAEIERLAEADPENPELQVALGNAYLQKLFGMSGGPEAGTWALKSDAAFGQALVLDSENWAARFLKAVSLSNWPAFLGKGPEAIDHFETLVEQQESMPPRPEFAQTYLYYGNVLAASGRNDEALEVWQQGLLLFPDMKELRQVIEQAQAQR